MSRLTRWLAPKTTARAHCDIPCGIYDPHEAEIAARTVARMVELIGQIDPSSMAVADRNKFIRCVTVKEQHAELVKHEVQVIWSDYFKPEHLEKFPDLHDKVWKILKLAGKNKQTVDAGLAAQLEASGGTAWGVWQIPESELHVLGDVRGRDVLELGCGAARWSCARPGGMRTCRTAVFSASAYFFPVSFAVNSMVRRTASLRFSCPSIRLAHVGELESSKSAM